MVDGGEGGPKSRVCLFFGGVVVDTLYFLQDLELVTKVAGDLLQVHLGVCGGECGLGGRFPKSAGRGHEVGGREMGAGAVFCERNVEEGNNENEEGEGGEEGLAKGARGRGRVFVILYIDDDLAPGVHASLWMHKINKKI